MYQKQKKNKNECENRRTKPYIDDDKAKTYLHNLLSMLYSIPLWCGLVLVRIDGRMDGWIYVLFFTEKKEKPKLPNIED
jgi:hypothetical protein